MDKICIYFSFADHVPKDFKKFNFFYVHVLQPKSMVVSGCLNLEYNYKIFIVQKSTNYEITSYITNELMHYINKITFPKFPFYLNKE